eukprot:Cvel_27373.t1-p1 / transcript=Cvel_27373.t1 / gene=Cvel_27373 / organism=Chromera_velia_CCMP2878 / gene_product=hypothetical protein / transcript_product=hypothetical protein / location=Cvel_scaffold3404:15876-16872(+) / protein_length=284 / sequence_SO=supercontig / SO=protein_coding / is_pseudo=false
MPRLNAPEKIDMPLDLLDDEIERACSMLFDIEDDIDLHSTKEEAEKEKTLSPTSGKEEVVAEETTTKPPSPGQLPTVPELKEVSREAALMDEINSFYSRERLFDCEAPMKKLFDICESQKKAEQKFPILRTIGTKIDGMKDFLVQLDSDEGWTEHVSHTPKLRVCYKPTPGSTIQTFRIEGLVNAPIQNVLSVLYEFDMYKNWVPEHRIPKMGLAEASKLNSYGVIDMIVKFRSMLPWPLSDRSVGGWTGRDVGGSEGNEVPLLDPRVLSVTVLPMFVPPPPIR